MNKPSLFTPKQFDIPGPTVLVGLVKTDTGIQLVKATVVNDKLKTINVGEPLSKLEAMHEIQRKMYELFLEITHG